MEVLFVDVSELAEIVWFPPSLGKTDLTALLRGGFHHCKPSPSRTWKLVGRDIVCPESSQACGTRLREGTNTFRLKTLIREPTYTRGGHFYPGSKQLRSLVMKTAPSPPPPHSWWFSTGSLTCVLSINTLHWIHFTTHFEFPPLPHPTTLCVPHQPVTQTRQFQGQGPCIGSGTFWPLENQYAPHCAVGLMINH